MRHARRLRGRPWLAPALGHDTDPRRPRRAAPMPALFTGASSSPAIDLSASSLPPGTRLSPPVAVTAGTRVCAPNACAWCASCAKRGLAAPLAMTTSAAPRLRRDIKVAQPDLNHFMPLSEKPPGMHTRGYLSATCSAAGVAPRSIASVAELGDR